MYGTVKALDFVEGSLWLWIKYMCVMLSRVMSSIPETVHSKAKLYYNIQYYYNYICI